ncbi:putative EamA domain-containing protein [Seiridium cardinale]
MPRNKKETQPSPAAAPKASSSPTTSSAAPALTQTLRRRPQAVPPTDASQEKMVDDETRSNVSATDEESATTTIPASWSTRNQWIVLAIASGACAAFNGVFAKLTTNDLTSNISQSFAKAFGLTAIENIIELIVRCAFFGLNLVFNGVMWTLFTKALARGSSTTQVSIMNTSTNFMITAILGFIIFSESLPPLWWLGAAMLVAGNVIIGRKVEAHPPEEEDATSVAESSLGVPSFGTVPQVEGILPVEKDDEDEDVALLGDLDDSHDR